jgi:hypothetical protein
MRQCGIKLMLDFVPNHMAPDHPWIHEHPDYFVHGTEADLLRTPQNYCRIETKNGPLLLAHGRDPYFDGWPDTLQLNFGNAALRTAMANELATIADQCDGVRCDMAMLVAPEVFERTWGIRGAPFWPDAIASVRNEHPDFLFMAEVYWDMEWTLQQQGFDYTYDKRLYDRLQERSARSVREHLGAEMRYQNKLARFLENHDEPRAAMAFPHAIHQPAAVLTYFSPGLRFFHDGQFEGRLKRISPHLIRRPDEATDEQLAKFYALLLAALRLSAVRDGSWSLLECVPAWHDNWTADNFIAFSWERLPQARVCVVVNYSPHQSQCFVRVSDATFTGRIVRFQELLGTTCYDRSGDDLLSRGLFVDLPPWAYHVFNVQSTT